MLGIGFTICDGLNITSLDYVRMLKVSVGS